MNFVACDRAIGVRAGLLLSLAMAQAMAVARKMGKTTGKTGASVYKRVLLKISGEGFSKEGGFGIARTELEEIAMQCVEVAKTGVQLAVVVGGGNFVRGATLAEVGDI